MKFDRVPLFVVHAMRAEVSSLVWVCSDRGRYQCVANVLLMCAVIVGVAIVLGESLDPIKLLGCAIGIGGVCVCVCVCVCLSGPSISTLLHSPTALSLAPCLGSRDNHTTSIH